MRHLPLFFYPFTDPCRHRRNILFTTRDRLSTIRDSARILVLNGGEIVEQGSHDELMAMNGFYYTLYMSQFKGKAPGGEAAGTAAFASS